MYHFDKRKYISDRAQIIANVVVFDHDKLIENLDAQQYDELLDLVCTIYDKAYTRALDDVVNCNNRPVSNIKKHKEVNYDV